MLGTMARSNIIFVFIVCCFAVIASTASAALVEHSFMVGNLTVNRLCRNQLITAVNGSLPGPTIRVQEGDTLVVHVFNQSPYNMSIHWHGMFQLLSGWADGPAYITQCPILPGNSYTYRFNVTRQEGTLWWHAHVSYLRATVYGALVIRPRSGHSYPFPKPHKEVPIILGEWWNANPVEVEDESLANGGSPNNSDAYTINGRPGDLYNCSSKHTFKLKVKQGKTYLLRIINAALNNQLFFKIADHTFTVVGMDACYTDPYITDVVVIAPGQTTDVLLTANQPVGSYYMAAHPYISIVGVPFPNTTTTGIIQYEGSTSPSPKMPILPAFNDTPTAHKFFTNITGLRNAPHRLDVVQQVDKHMFVTIGLGVSECGSNANCTAFPFGGTSLRLSASMNNASFEHPTKLSLLEAFNSGVKGIYTEDFPSQPPVKFDYTNTSLSFDSSLWFAEKGTRVTKLKFNETVEVVLQNTAFVGLENHPIHLHGFNFHILAQGFGNYNASTAQKMFNLVNPQERNTIAVPVGGWAVIRFRADNPGVWMMHCHLDVHLPWGLATAFVVENGPTPSTTLPPPPLDLPTC